MKFRDIQLGLGIRTKNREQRKNMFFNKGQTNQQANHHGMCECQCSAPEGTGTPVRVYHSLKGRS